MNNNPLPATHGRICHHPCEDACNRVQIADVVSIHAIERFLGDMAISQNWPMRTTQADTGKKMLVVGASIRSDDGLPSATPRHRVDIRDVSLAAGGLYENVQP